MPYRRVRKVGDTLEQCEAVVKLLVHDRSPTSTFTGFLPFLVDTGSDVTLIPRTLVPSDAFPVEEALEPYEIPVEGLMGGSASGRIFSASLVIVPPAARYRGLSFKNSIVVVDSWRSKYAILGLDAIRQVVMVSDDQHVSFWPL
ncbi:MAG: hypothetical protein IH820_04845 [Bacteroidetes bacterium]|nr:hypothetical protein [Bacteroidota bacterium]